MTAALLAGAWAATVAYGAGHLWRRRPPARVRELRPVAAAPAANAVAAGPTVVAVVPFPLLSLPAGVAVGVSCALAVWCLPRWDGRRRHQRRLDRLRSELPEVVDLLVLAAGAGLTVGLAIEAVGRRASGELAAELRAVTGATRQGRRLADALGDLPDRAGDAVRPLVAALVACERYGAPLVPALDRLAGEVRADRRRRADETARKVSVKLLFPLVLCVLPAFALLTVAPLIASALRSLRL